MNNSPSLSSSASGQDAPHPQARTGPTGGNTLRLRPPASSAAFYPPPPRSPPRPGPLRYIRPQPAAGRPHTGIVPPAIRHGDTLRLRPRDRRRMRFSRPHDIMQRRLINISALGAIAPREAAHRSRVGGPGASLPCESPPERVFDVPSAGSGRRRPRGNAAGNPARKVFYEMFASLF